MNGKGDKPRPVDKERYERNYERINWGPAPKSLREAVQITVSEMIYTSAELEQLREDENGIQGKG